MSAKPISGQLDFCERYIVGRAQLGSVLLRPCTCIRSKTVWVLSVIRPWNYHSMQKLSTGSKNLLRRKTWKIATITICYNHFRRHFYSRSWLKVRLPSLPSFHFFRKTGRVEIDGEETKRELSPLHYSAYYQGATPGDEFNKSFSRNSRRILQGP